MNIKKHIPNLITLSNLFCGILAVKLGFDSDFLLAGGFIILGAIFDFFDGFAARLLKVSNEIGKQLDSLADMVTFGVAPGVIIFSLLSNLAVEELSPINSLLDCEMSGKSIALYYFYHFIPYLAFLIPLMSAVRLARFNVDENQSDKFIGLPTPANSMFFISLPLICNEYIKTSISPIYLIGILLFLVLLFSSLLNSKIELLALKFNTFGWQKNEFRYVFMGLSLVTIIVFFLMSYIYFSIPIIILLYLISSIIKNNINIKQKQ